MEIFINMAQDKNKDKGTDNEKELTGSKSDPQKTEMEGLKKGGVEPNVHHDDLPRDKKGKTDQ